MQVKDIVHLYDKLLDIARYHNATVEEAEDVVQDLYLKLMEIQEKEGNINRMTYRGKINMVYLFNTLRNKIYNNKRTTNRCVCLDNMPELVQHPPSMAGVEVNDRLVKMGAYYHKFYDAYMNDNISMRELAKRTDISVSTVFYTVRAIKMNLKSIFYEQANDTGRKEKVGGDKIKG